MTPITRTYPLDEPTDLQIFADDAHFIRKLKKHFLNPGEPWGRVFGVNFLRQLGQKLKEQDVSLLEEAYRLAIEAIDGGLRYCAGLPLFLRIEEPLSPSFPLRCRWTYYFLAEAGFKIVAYGGVVRSVYFMSKTAQESKYTLFREAWHALRARALTPLLLTSPTGPKVHRCRCRWYSHENWTSCPNPHPAPPKGPRRLPSEIDEWLAEVAFPREVSGDRL